MLIENYNTLTLNQKIQYYTLFTLEYYDGSLFNIEQFYKENKQIIDTIKLDLGKKFPKIKGIEKTKDEVFLEFIGRGYY